MDDCFGTLTGVGPLAQYKIWTKEPHNNLRRLSYHIVDHFSEEYINRTTRDGSEKNCDEIHIMAHKQVAERDEATEKHSRMKAREDAKKAKTAADKKRMESHLNLASPGRGQTPPSGTGQLSRQQKAGLEALGKNPTSSKVTRTFSIEDPISIASSSDESDVTNIFGDYSSNSSKARSNKAVDKKNAEKAAKCAVDARKAAAAGGPAKSTSRRSRSTPRHSDLNDAVVRVQSNFMKQRDEFGTLLKSMAQNPASSMSPKKRKRLEINELKNQRQQDIDARKSTDPEYKEEVKEYTESIKRANAMIRRLENEYHSL